MKTSLSGSSNGSSRNHCSRKSRTSSRSCSSAWSVFFIPVSQPVERPLHGHNRTGGSAECFELFERCVFVPANQLIEFFEGGSIKNRPPVTSGKRSDLAGLAIPEKPALKGARINPAEFCDLCLSSLMVQVGCNSPLTRIGSGGFFHVTDDNTLIRHLNG